MSMLTHRSKNELVGQFFVSKFIWNTELMAVFLKMNCPLGLVLKWHVVATVQ